VKGAGPQWGYTRPGTGSLHPVANQSSSGGNETAEASGAEGRYGDLASVQAVTVSERRAGPETGDAGADPPVIEGRPQWVKSYERTSFIQPAGVLATACTQWGPCATREVPAVIAVWINDQLATRERQAGPFGMAERLVVPMKPGNSGGGKGPQLKGNARSNKGPRDWR